MLRNIFVDQYFNKLNIECLKDGMVYVFHFKKNLSRVLDVYDKGTENGTNVQIWIIIMEKIKIAGHKTGNYFMFKVLNSGKFIDVEGGKAEHGANKIIYQKNNGKIINRGDGYCSFESKINANYYLDVKYGGEGGEYNVWLHEKNNSDAQIFKPIPKIIYKFGVGVRGLGISQFEPPTRLIDITHAAFLIGTDLFEYGTDNSKVLGYIGIKTKKPGYFRIKNNDRYKKNEPFEWDRIGNKLNGTTWIQPDELNEILYNSGKWLNDNYNVLAHNCHDFVKECLIIGMINKVFPTFRPH